MFVVVVRTGYEMYTQPTMENNLEVYPSSREATNFAEGYIKQGYLEEDEEIEVWEVSKRYKFDYPPHATKSWQEIKE